MSHKILSHYLGKDTPLYGWKKNIFIENRSSIEKGDCSNSVYMKSLNLAGTYIDFPPHFSSKGKTINDYSASFWNFNKVTTINYPVKSNHIINDEILIGNDISEDMKLDEVHGSVIKNIVALPLLVDNVVGSPIMILAEFDL